MRNNRIGENTDVSPFAHCCSTLLLFSFSHEQNYGKMLRVYIAPINVARWIFGNNGARFTGAAKNANVILRGHDRDGIPHAISDRSRSIQLVNRIRIYLCIRFHRECADSAMPVAREA